MNRSFSSLRRLASTMALKSLSLDRFKGCLVGGVMGDCLGAPFEGDAVVGINVVTDYLSGMDDAVETHRQPYKSYTDDTALTFALANSLLEKNGLFLSDLAARYTHTFLSNPRRGYGAAVGQIFIKMAEEKLYNSKDEGEILTPAKFQFAGQGSYGNGAAMRVSPAALFHARDNIDQLIDTARRQSLITHSNGLGVLGSVVQAVAVRLALNAEQEINPADFIAQLKEAVGKVEKVSDVHRAVFVEKLDTVLEFLKKKQLDDGELVKFLGNDITAHGSVPTAVYAFLKSLQPSDEIKTDSIVLRTVFAAIRLGGDTDTIASMAGSIAGAYHGEQAIPRNLLLHCEGVTEAEELAEKFFNRVN